MVECGNSIGGEGIFRAEIGVKRGKKYDNVIGDHDDFTPELINTIFTFFNDCKGIFIWGRKNKNLF